MYSKVALLSALLRLAAADELSASMSAVEADLSELNSLVTAWSSGAGLSGALVIQQSYDPLSSAIVALESVVSGTSLDASSVSSHIDQVNSLASAISTLMGSLVDKAADFTSVGALSIVGGDIAGLSGPSAQILSDLISNLPSDVASSDVVALNSDISAIAAAFSSGASAFSTTLASSFPSGATAASESASASATSTSESSTSESASASASATTSMVPSTTLSSATSYTNGTSGDVYTTTTQTEYTTYCPEPTTFTRSGKTYTITEATTLTITDCNCTATTASTTSNHTTTGTSVTPNAGNAASFGAAVGGVAIAALLM